MADSDTAPTRATAVAADLADERLIKSQGLSGYLRLQFSRLRSGDLGNLPVIIGLVLISVGFYAENARFLSSRNLVAITPRLVVVYLLADVLGAAGDSPAENVSA